MAFNGWSVLSLLLFLVGVGFWLSMPSRGDVGVYALGIVLVGFGVAGLLASLASRRPAA